MVGEEKKKKRQRKAPTGLLRHLPDLDHTPFLKEKINLFYFSSYAAAHQVPFSAIPDK